MHRSQGNNVRWDGKHGWHRYCHAQQQGADKAGECGYDGYSPLAYACKSSGSRQNVSQVAKCLIRLPLYQPQLTALAPRCVAGCELRPIGFRVSLAGTMIGDEGRHAP
jgi:hypothetical protein